MPITKEKVSYFLDLEDEMEFIPKSKRASFKKEVAETVLNQIKKDMANGISSVSGQRWQGLSKSYKKQKQKLGKGSSANLRLFGNLKDSMSSVSKTDGVELKVKGRIETLKAFNHNEGDTLPKRQFYPDDELGEDFRAGIRSKINEVKSKYESERLKSRANLTDEEEEIRSRLLDELRRDFGL